MWIFDWLKTCLLYVHVIVVFEMSTSQFYKAYFIQVGEWATAVHK